MLRPYIKILANRANFLRVGTDIYPNWDPRPKGQRPLVADMLLSYWLHYLNFPIESLRKLFLDKVEEDTMNEMRPDVYGLMRKDLGQSLYIQRNGDQVEERAAFDMIYKDTKFGRCVRTIETENLGMLRAGIKVSHFEIEPRDYMGAGYNLTIAFQAEQIEEEQRQRRRRRRH